MINLTIGSIKCSMTVLRELVKIRCFFCLAIFNKNVAMRLSLLLLGNLQNKVIAIFISRGFSRVRFQMQHRSAREVKRLAPTSSTQVGYNQPAST